MRERERERCIYIYTMGYQGHQGYHKNEVNRVNRVIRVIRVNAFFLRSKTSALSMALFLQPKKARVNYVSREKAFILIVTHFLARRVK